VVKVGEAKPKKKDAMDVDAEINAYLKELGLDFN